MRVHVTGQLRLVSWDDDGEARADLRLTAERLSIDPICLDSVQVRKRNSQTTDINGNGQARSLSDLITKPLIINNFNSNKYL